MEIKDFIEKARIGGCDIANYHPLYVTTSEPKHAPLEGFLFNPLAWQAVGKVEGWDVVNYKKRIGTTSNSFRTKLITVTRKASIKQGSIARMHRMIDALAEGKTIEEFLKTL